MSDNIKPIVDGSSDLTDLKDLCGDRLKESGGKYGNPSEGVFDSGWLAVSGDRPYFIFRVPGLRLGFTVKKDAPSDAWVLVCNGRCIEHYGSFVKTIGGQKYNWFFETAEDARRWAEDIIKAMSESLSGKQTKG